LNREDCVRIYDLLTELEKQNDYPIVLNTSFNVKDQTMIRDPKTAIDTFLDVELDMLVIEDYVITKK
jgi:carbamoyltransferase